VLIIAINCRIALFFLEPLCSLRAVSDKIMADVAANLTYVSAMKFWRENL